MIDPADLSPLDAAKARDALVRFRLEVVGSSQSSSFDAGYDMLDSFFGPLGELEDRAALADFVDAGLIPYTETAEGHYRMILAWDGDRLAGVRDFYVDLEREQRLSVIALSHAYVAPEYRRTGLAALFRAAPSTLGREVLGRVFPGLNVPCMVTAEMEPADPDHPETIVRLIAYGRSGFSVLDPRWMRYSQPDFRDVVGLGFGHTALPLLGVVRRLDDPRSATAPKALAAAFPQLFHVCHRMYLPRWRVDPSESYALSTLEGAPDDIALLPLPTGPENLDRLRPLLRGAILPLYPTGLRGPAEGWVDPETSWTQLRRAWGGSGGA